MKDFFKNMPIEVTHDEYLKLASILYASLQCMISENEKIYILDSENKKVFCFDVITEINKIKDYAARPKHHFLQIN